jgi:hypothetical protein
MLRRRRSRRSPTWALSGNERARVAPKSGDSRHRLPAFETGRIETYVGECMMPFMPTVNASAWLEVLVVTPWIALCGTIVCVGLISCRDDEGYRGAFVYALACILLQVAVTGNIIFDGGIIPVECQTWFGFILAGFMIAAMYSVFGGFFAACIAAIPAMILYDILIGTTDARDAREASDMSDRHDVRRNGQPD